LYKGQSVFSDEEIQADAAAAAAAAETATEMMQS
jgi:hypothetical protein